MPEPELQELLREQLLEATSLRLRSDVPVGAFLSGGVDSSSVVAALAHLGTRRLMTFSVGFDEPAFDERAAARDVAQRYDTDHHELSLDSGAVDVLPLLVWRYGEPFADASALACLHLSELTRRHVTVALAGDGGDENFAGYHRYRRIAAYDGDVSPREPAQGDEHLLNLVSHLLSWDYFGAADRRSLYTQEFLAGVGEPSVISVLADPYLESDAADVLGRVLDVDIQTYLSQDILVKMDRASMAHGLEVRSPLLDHMFLETAAAMPSHMKLRGDVSKRIYRDAMRPWLPAHILERAKMGFSVPLSEWFRGPKRELPTDVLLDSGSLGRGMFREDAVRRLITEHRSEAADHSAKLWSLITLELWLRTFVDRHPSGPVARP